MRNYQREVVTYTKGQGHLTTSFGGYFPCHNAEEVITSIGYEAERDLEHTADSVFCAHGAGFVVPWNMVPDYMHLESCLIPIRSEKEVLEQEAAVRKRMAKERQTAEKEIFLGTEEIDRILAQAYNANKRDKSDAEQEQL